MFSRIRFKFVLRLGIMIAMGVTISEARADALLEDYVAQLSARDHVNSNGDRLHTAAAIIRQDRANFHLFGRSDHRDTGDSYFGDAGNRELLEVMLERGKMDADAEHAILNGEPIILVRVYRDTSTDRDYVVVSVAN